MADEQTRDETLIEQAQRGDRAALTGLVERHHAPLVGYLYHATNGRRDLAEDLAQEAFIRVVQNLSAYQPGRPFKPWLYTIATNLVRDHYRRLDTRRTAEWSDALEDAAARPEEDPEAAFLTAERGGAVSAALLQLSAPLRATLLLRFSQDLSLEEIAQVLGIPPGTVKSRLSNAVRQLRDHLAAQESAMSAKPESARSARQDAAMSAKPDAVNPLAARVEISQEERIES